MNLKYNKKKLPAVFFLIFAMFAVIMFFPGVPMEAESNKPPEANRMKPDHAPTPFSAEAIYAGCPRDRKIVYQVETLGQPVIFQTIKFVTVYEDEVVFETVTTGMDGKQRGPKRMTTGKWKDLQAHASFPEKQTSIRKVSFTVPAGTFDCWLYEVTLEKDGKTSVQKYWFAINLPGPPVCFEETANDRVAYKMTMLKTGK